MINRQLDRVTRDGPVDRSLKPGESVKLFLLLLFFFFSFFSFNSRWKGSVGGVEIALELNSRSVRGSGVSVGRDFWDFKFIN